MNSVGSEGDFASGVEDVFLAGFEAWGELGQMQSPLLGAGPGQAMGGGGAVGGVGSPGAVGVGITGGGRALPGIGSMTGLGGSMQSFLGEAGMYPDSAGSGMDSIRDEFSGADSNDGRNNNVNINNGNHHQHNLNSGVGDNISSSTGSKLYGGGGGGGTNGRDLGVGCKIETMEHDQDEHGHDEHDRHDEHEDDPDDDELCHDDDSDDDRDQDEDEDAMGGGSALGDDDEGARHQQHQQQDGGSLRGLGRIFGMGTHPVVAEAQARAEALVHGRGARGGGSSSAAEAAEKKRKRAVLSKEERAKQNRDRNREHARNTRLRKKAFVEELKKQVEELVATREREERQRRAECRRDAALRDIRLQVLLTFLEYRGRAEMGRQEWQSVLDDHFEMRMPITPYRTFPPQQVQGGMRVIKGLNGVLADTASLSMATKASSVSGRPTSRPEAASPKSSSDRKGKAKGNDARLKRSFSETTGSSFSSRGATSSESCSGGEGDEATAGGGGAGQGVAGGGVGVGVGAAAAAAAAAGMVPSANRVYYVVDPKEVMVDKNAFMCPFLARSPQLLVPGMLKCTFSTKSNRLSTVQFSFDPTVPARQLARAAMLQGRATPGMAGMVAGMLGMGGVDVPSVMGRGPAPAPATAGAPESRVTVKSETATASSPPQGLVGQDEGVLHSVLEDIREWRVSSTLVDDPKHGKSFLRVYPLSGETPGVTHFIGVLEVLSTAQPAASSASASAMGEMAAASSAGSAHLSTGAALGGGNSSGLEAGASEGETSSDSTSSSAKRQAGSGRLCVLACWALRGCLSSLRACFKLSSCAHLRVRLCALACHALRARLLVCVVARQLAAPLACLLAL
eukprot:jgi/Undpi1/11801/HiC_scaffold_4.g01500.m1